MLRIPVPAKSSGEKPLNEKPRARRRFRVPKWAWWTTIVLVSLFGAQRWRQARAAAVPQPEVKTALVSRGDVRATVSATGTLQAFTLVDVKSKAGGTVLKMAVEEGTRVKRGQLIALIDRQDTTASYRQAVADVDAARAALSQSRDNARLQQAQLGPQIRQSQEGVAAADARARQAQENLALQRETLGPQIEQSAQAVAAASARLRQARQNLAVERATGETAVREAQSGLNSARARLSQAQEQAAVQPALSQASVNQAQAGIEGAQAGIRAAEEALRQLTGAAQPQARAAAEAQVAQTRSDVTTAETNLARQRGLLGRGFVAQSTVDAAENAAVSARSALATAQARLDTLAPQQDAERREAQSRVESARGSLKSSQAGLQTARANTVQNRLRQRDVQTARAAVEQAQAALADAIVNRRQVAVRQADVESAQATLRQSQAALQSTRADSRQVSVRASDVQSAQAALRQAQAALQGSRAGAIQNQVRQGDIAAAQARLARAEVTAANARQNLEQTRVVAPRDGIVLKKYVDEGTIIQSGQSGAAGGTSVVQLAQVSQMFVDVQVDEADIALIEPGQRVDITLDAYPNTPKTGRVRKIFPAAETVQTVTYIHVQVEVDAMDVDERLRPNMNATCDFLVEEAENAITVPTEAVKEEEDTTTVTVIKDLKKPLWEETNQVKRTVEIGVRGDDATEVTSGVKEGETVVTQIIEPITAETAGAPGAGRGGIGGMGGMGGRGGMGGGGRGR